MNGDYSVPESGVRHVPAANPNGPGTPNTDGDLADRASGVVRTESVNNSDRPGRAANSALDVPGVRHDVGGPDPATRNTSAGRVRHVSKES